MKNLFSKQLSPENVLDVLCLADVFILSGLKKLCASVVQENLTTDNIMSVLKLVRLYNLPRLEDHCTEFMAKHLEEVCNVLHFLIYGIFYLFIKTFVNNHFY